MYTAYYYFELMTKKTQINTQIMIAADNFLNYLHVLLLLYNFLSTSEGVMFVTSI